jgi:hypothetical protein
MLYGDLFDSTRDQSRFKKPDFKEQTDILSDLFDMFNQPSINNPELNNVQRFQLLAEQQREKGNLEYAATFDSLGAQTNAVLKLLGSFPNQNEPGEKDYD